MILRCAFSVQVASAFDAVRREFGRAYDASRQVLDARTLGDALNNTPYAPDIRWAEIGRTTAA